VRYYFLLALCYQLQLKLLLLLFDLCYQLQLLVVLNSLSSLSISACKAFTLDSAAFALASAAFTLDSAVSLS
jgi:hypothetical protein